MRILFVSEFYPPKIMGGGEINLQQMAEALALDAEVSVLTTKFEDLPPYERVNEVKVFRRLKGAAGASGVVANFKRSFFLPDSIVSEVKTLLVKEKFDVIHFIGISIIAAKRLSNLNIPLVATVESYPALCPKGDRIYHGKRECRVKCSLAKFTICQSKCSEIGKTKNAWYLKYNPLFLLYVYRFHSKIKNGLKYCRLIAISDYLKYVLSKHGHGSVVIPNIIDVNAFRPRTSGIKMAMEAMGLKNLPLVKLSKSGKKKVLYLGSLTKFKGPQILLEAVKGLDVHVDLYGDGVLKEELQKYIEDNNLDAEIHDPVSYDQIPKIYSKADIVVFPSLWPEPFGRIAVEGLAAGKLVIGSDIGGIRETLQENGILVKPGDVDAWREALQSTVKTVKVDLGAYRPDVVEKQLLKFYIRQIPEDYYQHSR